MPSQELVVDEFVSGSNAVVPPSLPPPLPRRLPAIDYWKIDCRKLRLREWLRSTGVLTALIGWACGRVGVNIPAGQRTPIPQDWSELAIPEGAILDDVRQRFSAKVAELCGAGFQTPTFFHVVNRFNGYEDFGALLVGPSGHTLACILWSRALPGHKIRERFEVAFLTGSADGRYVWTCDQPLRFDKAPEIFAAHRTRVSITDLAGFHEETVANQFHGAPVRPITTTTQAWSVYNAYEAADHRFQEARGLHSQPSAEEASNDAELARAEQTAAERGSRFGGAWAELQKAQIQKASAINGKLLLLVTVIVSAVVGFGQRSPKGLAFILAVLFFHELGHYVAMRVFKYRNVKMFFLPGFGAAVSGRNHNVPGWKKAIVSLLGPVPGIWLGAALAAYAAFAGDDQVGKAALMLILLNVINLLPIVPLDGGWFWNSVLFSRASWLEVVFKGFAGLCGVAACLGGLGRIWMYLGIVTLVSLPHVWIQGRVAASLRRRGCTPASGDDERVPFELAESIFGELDSAWKGKMNAKNLGSSALQVFERLNAVPPNWLESLGLSTVYFASLVAALVGIGLAGLLHFDSEKFAKAKTKPEPALVLDAKYEGASQRSTPVTLDAKALRRFVIGQFPSVDAARKTYEQLGAEKSPELDLVCFGSSILVQGPAKKSGPVPKVAEALVHAGATLTDDADRSGIFSLALTATALSRETAAQLHHEIDLWLSLPTDLRPAAPWLGQTDPSVLRACETYRRIQDAKNEAAHDPNLRRLEKRTLFSFLFMRGESAASESRKIAETRDMLERQAVERLRIANDRTLDDAVLAQELARPKFPIVDRAAMAKWRAHLRQLVTHRTTPEINLPDSDDPDDDEEAIYVSDWRDHVRGKVAVTHEMLTLKGFSFGTPTRDFPALADWLIDRGCKDVRYGIQKQTYGEVTASLAALDQ